MTTTQINYMNAVETNRANLARETETNRANLAQERLTAQYNAEVRRHNLATEDLASKQFLNAQYQFAQQYQLDAARVSEQQRANLASERIASMNALTNNLQMVEQSRHNRVSEEQNLIALSQRYEVDLLNAGSTAKNAETNRLQQQVGAGSLAYNYAQLAESKRHNQATEQLNLSNLEQQQKQFDVKIGNDTARLLLDVGRMFIPVIR